MAQVRLVQIGTSSIQLGVIGSTLKNAQAVPAQGAAIQLGKFNNTTGTFYRDPTNPSGGGAGQQIQVGTNLLNRTLGYITGTGTAQGQTQVVTQTLGGAGYFSIWNAGTVQQSGFQIQVTNSTGNQFHPTGSQVQYHLHQPLNQYHLHQPLNQYHVHQPLNQYHQPLQNQDYTQPLQNQDYTQPLQNQDLHQGANQQDVHQVYNQYHSHNPYNQYHVHQQVPYNQYHVHNPGYFRDDRYVPGNNQDVHQIGNNQDVHQGYNQQDVHQTYNQQDIHQAYVQYHLHQPYNQYHVHQPLNQYHLHQPLNQYHVHQPLNQYSQPLLQQDYTQPLQNQDYTQPLQNQDVTTPTTQQAASGTVYNAALVNSGTIASQGFALSIPNIGVLTTQGGTIQGTGSGGFFQTPQYWANASAAVSTQQGVVNFQGTTHN